MLSKKIALIVALGVFALQTAIAQAVLTPKQIYTANRDAMVLIGVNGIFSGNGFIISADGLIATANHVVSTQQSGYSTYYDKIEVIRAGQKTGVAATPISRYLLGDVAIIKIEANNLRHVTLADSREVDTGDEVTIVAGFHGILEPLMIFGTVSIVSATVANPNLPPVNVIWFQAPVRKGFSGAPIFSSKGHVIGIVNTRIVGISPALDGVRNKLVAAANNPSVTTQGVIQGVAFGPTMVELITVLDQTIISGLGTAISAEYAQELKDKATKQSK